MKTGIIIARFQVAFLTKGHKFLIMKVLSKHKKIIILLGVPQIEYTNINPLTFQMRKRAVEEAFPIECMEKKITFLPLYDFVGNDVAWSNQIDSLLYEVQKPVIYYSRDGFGDTYSGIYRTKKLKPLENTGTGTDQRTRISNVVTGSRSFRAGIIHAIEKKFPTAYSTVDIALLKTERLEELLLEPDLKVSKVDHYVLLGRKVTGSKWVFPGGFVDPADKSLEMAAARELQEETGITETHELEYICSRKVDDGRYKGTKDGIMTTFFKTYTLGSKEPVAADDLAEVKWIKLADIDDYISPHHAILAKSLLINILGRYPANNIKLLS